MFKKMIRKLITIILSKPLLRKIISKLLDNKKGKVLVSKIKFIYFGGEERSLESVYLDPQAFEIYVELKNKVQRTPK